jgi:D-3-phosphoglycerate dehydrogenase
MSKLILANDGIDAVGKSLLEKAGFTVVTEKVAQENLASEINAKNYVALTVRSATKVRKDVIDVLAWIISMWTTLVQKDCK